MRTTRRPDSPPARPRPKRSSSATPNTSRWSEDSSSSESSNRSFDRFETAKEEIATFVAHDKFVETPLTEKKNTVNEHNDKRSGVGLSIPEKLPGALGLKRSPAIRLGIPGKKTQLHSASRNAETRGRGRTRTVDFKVEVLEFSKTKISMIKTGAKGSYGEYFLGMDEQGKLFGIKELRSKYEVDDLAREGKKANTQATLRIHASREVNDTKRFVPQLEVQDLVVGRDKKPYLIMKPMEGTVDDLLYNIDPEQRPLMGRTALYALAQHAAQIHKKGGIHGDMKTPNALWSKEGFMCAADCGLSSRTPTNTVIRGTYFSPEMIEGRAPYDHKVDTWSLMVSLVASLNPDGGDAAFAGKSVQEIRNKLIGFSAWRRFQLGGQLPPQWNNYLNDNPFNALFAPLIATDPILARYVVKHGLDPIPESRASCEEVVRHMFAMGHGPGEQAQALQKLGTLPRDPIREQQENHLRDIVASKSSTHFER